MFLFPVNSLRLHEINHSRFCKRNCQNFSDKRLFWNFPVSCFLFRTKKTADMLRESQYRWQALFKKQRRINSNEHFKTRQMTIKQREPFWHLIQWETFSNNEIRSYKFFWKQRCNMKTEILGVAFKKYLRRFFFLFKHHFRLPFKIFTTLSIFLV